MINKFLLRWFSSLILTIALLGGSLLTAKAQTSRAGNTIVSFLAFGEQDTVLAGPWDSRHVSFRLPADWSMLSDSILHVNLNAATGMTSNSGVVGFFEVYLNDTWLTTVNITTDGEYSVDVPIPSSAWVTTRNNTPQKLKFVLVDALRCEMWLSASAAGGSVRGFTAVLRSSSYIDFKYDTLPVSTDLKLFPYPIFQGTFRPDKTVLVIPDQPTQGEMQAAMTISAAFGRFSDGKLDLQLITISKLNDTLSKGSNLVFIGSPATFPQLTSANFPAPYNGTNFENVQIGDDDGILEMVVSPKNPAKVWLLVSGNSEAAIIKASQAVGSDQIQPYGPENLAVITGIGTDDQNINKTDFNFADLGYPFEQTYTGYFNDLGIWFDMPANQQASDGTYFEMVFTNSPVLNFDASDVKVSINNYLIGGLRFSDRTTSITHWKFNIPTTLLHPGRNLLLLEVSLSGNSPCIDPDELWFSIAPESLLHLPTSAIVSNTARDIDLASYPSSIFSTYDQTALVLAGSDSQAWFVASKLAFGLGRQLGGSYVNLATYYADNVPSDVLNSRDLMLIGRPSMMPILDRFSQVMPAPFEKGQDITQEKNPQYSFLVTNSVPVGYIQVFSSPLDSRLTVLAVTGNMDESLTAAATALLTSSIQKQMVGNFIVVLNSKIIVQKVDMTTTSQNSPQIVLPDVQKPDDTGGQGGNTGKIKISLPLIVLIVVIVMVVIGVIVLFIMDKEDRLNKSVDNSAGQDVGEGKKK